MSLKYRPEIDGLRAIAVIAVVLFHAEFAFQDFNPLQGGFIGVDIFFVISGFLITTIVLREISTKSFSFANFYERRARRILPALFTVIIASLPFAWNLLLPDAYKDYAASVASSLLFGSNFWFWLGDSYWGEASSLKPFLHTWSLSVEEQFYLFFPILAILIWRFAHRYTTIIFISIILASLYLAESASINSPQAGFYLLHTRAWELMAGAILAKFELDNKFVSRPRLDKTLAFVGLILVIGSIIFFHEDYRHPSYLTAIPILGSVLLIRYSRQPSLVNSLLSNRLMVGIGLISYSLYLWHFPVFAFSKIHKGHLGLSDQLVNIVISFALAIATYFLIEKTTRKPAQMASKPFFSLIFASFVGLLLINTAILNKDGFPNRFINFEKFISYLHFDYKKDFMSHTCFLHPEDMNTPDPFQNCEIINKDDNKPTLLLWGDSNAAHLIPGIKETYGRDYQIIIRTSSGCGAFIGFEGGRPGCPALNDQIFDLAVSLNPDKLIIAGLWKIEFPELLEKTLVQLQEHKVGNIEVYGPVPRWTNSLPHALMNYGKYNSQAQAIPDYLPDRLHQEIFTIENEMKEMVTALGIDYYSATELLCKAGLGCLTNVGNEKLIQWDYGHLTSDGSRYLVNAFYLKSK